MKIIHIFMLFAFIATFNIAYGIDTADDNTKLLHKQLKNKDQAVAYNATAELAAQYRRDGDLKKAEKLLKDFQTPSGFDRLPRKTAIPYLRCLLETAHLRALKQDVAGSLQLLNWATSRKNDYERAISCLKYAEILVDLNEMHSCGIVIKSLVNIWQVIPVMVRQSVRAVKQLIPPLHGAICVTSRNISPLKLLILQARQKMEIQANG